MSHCIGAALIVAGALLAPVACFAQAAAADDVEVIRPPDVKPAPDEKKPDLAAAVKLIVERTNALRVKEGQAKVEIDDKLAAAARGFAAYMAANDRYGHTADGKRPADRAAASGYEYCIVLENIAYRYKSAGFTAEELAGVFATGWEKSPGHRKNMLDPDVTDTGVAIARSETTGYYYAVQMFGRPKSKAIEFEIANRSDAAVSYRIGEESFSIEPRYTRTHMRCRPPEVIIDFGDGKTQTIRPAHGERFAIAKDGGVKKE